MSRHAPDIPTLKRLETMHPLDAATSEAIALARLRTSDVLAGRVSGTIAIVGPCAMTRDAATIAAEGNQLAAMQTERDDLVLLHRMPPWKPRTNPDDWHGLETESSTVVQAYRTVAERAAGAANVAIELGYASHLMRYGARLSFGWTGSRHVTHDGLIDTVSQHQSLPVGIKNAMDGSIESALAHVDRINTQRGLQAAPAVLIYRGGQNAQNPAAWERAYRDALERTEGRLIVDTAHGGEMAFDPYRRYGKSVRGQIACMELVLRLADAYGEVPAGIMLEASDALSPTDPVMPFRVALDGVEHLHKIRSGGLPVLLA